MNRKATTTIFKLSGLLLLIFLFGSIVNNDNSNFANIDIYKSKETNYSKSIEIQHQTTLINGNGNPINSLILQGLSSQKQNNIVIQQAPGTIIEGLAFTGTNITIIDSPNSIIRDNTINKIAGETVYGIYVINSENTIIENNKISDLDATTDVYGIYIKDSLNVIINRNDISFLSAVGDTYGIMAIGNGSVTITGNNISQLSGDYIHGIDLRLIGGNDVVHSNKISELSGFSLSGILSLGTNPQIIEMNTITRLITIAAGREVVGIVLFGNKFTVLNNILEDLFVTGADKLFGYGILVNSETFTVANNSISNIRAVTTTDYVNVYGIYLQSGLSSSNLISNNLIENIFADGITDANAFGLFITRSSSFTVEFNTILNIQATSPNGLLKAEIFMHESNLGNFNFIEGSTYPLIWSHDGLTNYNQYFLYLDNVNIGSNTWIGGSSLDSTKIRIDTDHPVGSYENTILIIDTINSLIPITDTITVKILPVTIPIVIVPVLIDTTSPQTELGSIDNNAIWVFVDDNPSYYTLFTNDVLVVNSTWNSGEPILYNIDDLGPGNYNFTIFVFDLDGNSDSNTIIVNIQDTLFPEISYFANEQLEQEILSSNITWYLTDLHPDYFRLYANGTEVLNGTWQNDITITFNLFGWDIGLTNFTMEVQDLYGHVAKSTVFLSVVDSIEPFLNEPFDFFFDEGDFGYILKWFAEDLNPGNWTLYENGINYQNGTWQSKKPIIINLDDYKWGKYNFTIFVHDQFGNTIADTVLVNVFLNSDSPYKRNAETKSTSEQSIFENINPVYIAVGGAVVGVATLGSVLRRRRGF